jgi:hypothetical protein
MDAKSFRCELAVNLACQRRIMRARDDDGGTFEMALEQAFEDVRELCNAFSDV